MRPSRSGVDCAKRSSILQANLRAITLWIMALSNVTSVESVFDTKRALSKHMNTHRDSKWMCDRCGKGFDYESRMLQHQRVHDNEARLYCPHKTCDRSFKNVGDYNRHAKTHEAGGWYSCNKCSYKNKDKRNCDSHMRIHTADGEKERYECGCCHKQMRFSTQVKRHKETGCDPSSL